MHQETIYK